MAFKEPGPCIVRGEAGKTPTYPQGSATTSKGRARGQTELRVVGNSVLHLHFPWRVWRLIHARQVSRNRTSPTAFTEGFPFAELANEWRESSDAFTRTQPLRFGNPRQCRCNLKRRGGVPLTDGEGVVARRGQLPEREGGIHLNALLNLGYLGTQGIQ
jgi:hypothetical protein